jgi:uncharacterized protein YheU (UPF0270 family)
VIIPYHELSADALQGLIEEFINREGTDYGEVEYSLNDKVAQVQQQLQAQDIVIVYDAVMESVSLMGAQAAKVHEAELERNGSAGDDH